MTPDYNRAATAAAEILIKYGVSSAPVDPLPIIKKADGYNVVSFTEWSNSIGMNRENLIHTFAPSNYDAVSGVFVKDGKPYHLIAYNMFLSQHLVHRGLAREIGHFVLGHDGSKPEEIRNAEAMCFANHLLCPRPLIHAIMEAGVQITVEVLGNTTGCNEHCLMKMRKLPATHVDPALNRQVKAQFSKYIKEFIEFQSFLSEEDDSMIANFGSYMDGYEEYRRITK